MKAKNHNLQCKNKLKAKYSKVTGKITTAEVTYFPLHLYTTHISGVSLRLLMALNNASRTV